MKIFLTRIFSSWYFRWFLIGFLLRLVLAIFTFHSDIRALNLGAFLIAKEGVFNIYEYLQHVPTNNPLISVFRVDLFLYPILAYFVPAVFMWILAPLYDFSIQTKFLISTPELFGNLAIYRHLLLLKIPYFFFDLPLAFLLTKLFDDEKKKKMAFLLWLFNPVTLYATFMIGQFDIIPTFLVILSLVFALQKKPLLAALSLGFGGGFKLYPLLLLIPAIFILGKTFGERFKLALAGGLAFLFPILPYLPSSAFRSFALFTPKSQKMLFLSWNITGAEVLFPFVIIFVLIVLHASYFGKGKIRELWKYYFAVLLLFFSVTSYHPQWFLWLTPLIIIELLQNDFINKWLHLTLFAIFIFIVLMFESSLSYGLFAPILPKLANGPNLSDFVNRYYDVFQIKSILRSIFAAVSIWLILDLLIHQEKISEKT